MTGPASVDQRNRIRVKGGRPFSPITSTAMPGAKDSPVCFTATLAGRSWGAKQPHFAPIFTFSLRRPILSVGNIEFDKLDEHLEIIGHLIFRAFV